MISLNYRDSRPIYEQIKDGLRKLIVTGAIGTDEKLPSVRSLATQLSINPNTIQRAYNAEHGITPRTIVKTISNTLEISKKVEDKPKLGRKDYAREIARLQSAMRVAASNLDFEMAIRYREDIATLKAQMEKQG